MILSYEHLKMNGLKGELSDSPGHNKASPTKFLSIFFLPLLLLFVCLFGFSFGF